MGSTVVAVFVVVSRPKVNTILSSNRWAVSSLMSWQTTCPHPCSTSDPDSVSLVSGIGGVFSVSSAWNAYPDLS